MKNILSLMMLGMICISFQRCAEDSAPIFEKQKIQFSFNITSGDITNGRIEVSKLPEGSFLKISINNSSGETVISNLEIPILTFGDSYITEPLELPLGKYFITEFLIVKDSEVLFATPKRHSLLERLVDHPLPYSFNISKDKISNVAMQVLNISSQAPEAFGYASFNIEIVNPFLISVFIPQNGFALAGATAYIIKGADTISTNILAAKVNAINFKGADNGLHKLIIVKEGYDTYELEFKFNELKQQLADKPLMVVLEEVLELRITCDLIEDGYSIDLEGSGSIEIVWPDGSTETRSLPGSFGRSFEVGTNQIIKLKGDLDKITSFRAFGYSTGISKISGLQHLNALKHFAPGAPYYNATLDLSNNQNLESLDLWFFTLPEWFILPPKHNINGLTIELADRSITKEEIDILINNIYANSVDRNIRGGRIHLTNSDTPSQEALKKIQILIDNYGWEINLNL